MIKKDIIPYPCDECLNLPCKDRGYSTCAKWNNWFRVKWSTLKFNYGKLDSETYYNVLINGIANVRAQANR